MAISDFPVIDWRPIGQLPEVYAKGQERAREDEFRQALQSWQGTDYNDLVRRAAQAGSLPGIQTASQLANAQAAQAHRQATLDETKRYHDILAGQVNKPVVHWNPANPLDPNAPMTGVQIITDKQGRTRMEPISMSRGGAATSAAPTPDLDPFAGPQGAIPGPAPPPVGSTAPIRPNVIPTISVPGPRSDLSPTDELLARTAAGGVPAAPRGPQYAQAGGPPIPPPVAPGAVPDWLAGAAAPAMGRRPTEQPQALGQEQRGELRYTTPLGPFNEGAIAHLPAEVQNKIRAIATGRMNIKSTPITGASRDTLTNAVYSYFPGWDETIYTKRARALGNMAGGPEGRVVRAVNNLTDHLETATTLMDALQNKDMRLYNSVKNRFEEQFGVAAPSNVKAAAPIIAGEIMKVIAGTGAGGVHERFETAANTLNIAATPAQAVGALNTIKKLMAGQIKGLEQWYENNTYNTDFRSKIGKGALKYLEESETAPAEGVPPEGAPSGYKVLRVR
jgi:hypothetical protein